MISHKTIRLALGAALLSLVGVTGAGFMFAADPARAQSAEGFADYLPQLRLAAQAEGVSTATLDAVFPTLRYLPQVVRLDRSQPGSTSNDDNSYPPFAPYRDKHITASRIANGRDALASLRPTLERIESETGVPGAIMIAIYGKETNYGSYMGQTDIPSALATLAYEGRRRQFFTDEFVAAMEMIDDGVPRYKLEGSWAGAMGRPQFMPSTYHRLAKDGDGDGIADIWASEADAMASVANYLLEAGWRRGVPWGFAVDVPDGLDRAALNSRIRPTRCERVFERHSEWKSLDQWRALGVTPQQGYWPADQSVLATLLEPDGEGRTAYLLTSNYRVILDYNCSNYYALSVGLLADAVGS